LREFSRVPAEMPLPEPRPVGGYEAMEQQHEHEHEHEHNQEDYEDAYGQGLRGEYDDDEVLPVAKAGRATQGELVGCAHECARLRARRPI
jgi:hypothetical protein